jgi:DNA-binding transcriptional regulator YiaG
MVRLRGWEDFRNIATRDTCPEGPATAEEIRALRQRLGLSRADFGRVVGVGDGVIKQWEEGTCQPTLRNRRRLAAAAQREIRLPLLRR